MIDVILSDSRCSYSCIRKGLFDMATAALGSAYVLHDEGVYQLAEMSAGASAPVSAPGFRSHFVESSSAPDKLSALEHLVRAHTER